MSTGDQNDMLSRLNAVLPPWFGADETPTLTGLLSAFSNDGAFIYSQSAYVKLQMRITTATDNNLDLIANDFFGFNQFQRGLNEGDASYRARILASVLRERATRKGIIGIVKALTGNTPRYVQPSTPVDAGGYSVAGCGYGVAGEWGSLRYPYQAFLTAYVSQSNVLANVSGYNIPEGAWNTPSDSSWTSTSDVINSLTAQQIYSAIASTQCEGTIIWTQIIAT